MNNDTENGTTSIEVPTALLALLAHLTARSPDFTEDAEGNLVEATVTERIVGTLYREVLGCESDLHDFIIGCIYERWHGRTAPDVADDIAGQEELHRLMKVYSRSKGWGDEGLGLMRNPLTRGLEDEMREDEFSQSFAGAPE